jgi:hypothetical protein
MPQLSEAVTQYEASAPPQHDADSVSELGIVSTGDEVSTMLNENVQQPWLPYESVAQHAPEIAQGDEPL